MCWHGYATPLTDKYVAMALILELLCHICLLQFLCMGNCEGICCLKEWRRSQRGLGKGSKRYSFSHNTFVMHAIFKLGLYHMSCPQIFTIALASCQQLTFLPSMLLHTWLRVQIAYSSVWFCSHLCFKMSMAIPCRASMVGKIEQS